MLFKKKHIEVILAGRKTQTRRLPGKSANYSIGRVYAIRDQWFSKAQGYILITRKFRQRLGEISLEDIRKEGYNSLEEFCRAWEEVNGQGSWNPDQTVIAYEFKLVFSKPATPGRKSHPLGHRNGGAKRSTIKEMKNVNFIEEWFEKHKAKPLVDMLVQANRNLTLLERVRLLIKIAKELKVDPQATVNVSLSWKGESQ